MTDLPTRLRTEAAEHYRSGSKLWLCGIPEGSEMQARALLMRDAADEIERLTRERDSGMQQATADDAFAREKVRAADEILKRYGWCPSPASSPIVKTEN